MKGGVSLVLMSGSRFVPALRILALLAAGLAVPTGHLAAQTLTGRVVQEGSETPVAGAVVSLLDRDGSRRAATTADTVGRFVLTPPEAGEYIIEVTQFGYTTTRSPLFKMEIFGQAALDMMLTPEPLGLEGLEVEVEREAREQLGVLGMTPAVLGKRWIDRADIEKMPGIPDMRGALRSQNVSGLSLPRNPHALCLNFVRGEGCALTVLNGVPIGADQALDIDPNDVAAIAILTPDEATTFYGQQGVGGALLMWSR
jgi:hypothetical protein